MKRHLKTQNYISKRVARVVAVKCNKLYQKQKVAF